MANFGYSSFGGGADAAFNAADVNQDGRVDLGEFRNFLGQNLGATGGYGVSGGYGASSSSYGVGGGLGVAGGLGVGGSSYESSSSSFESSSTGLGGLAGFGGVGGASSYESSSYSASGLGADAGLAGGVVGAGYGVGVGAGYGTGYGAGVGAGYGAGVGGSSYNTVSSSSTQVQQYPTDAQGLFLDSNPQVIRRPAAGGVQTYTQNIKVRFLQPPPVPPPGPLIIKEVRPPQPPPPPPLRIRQQAPPLPQPPPLVLRERPPVPPASVASQTVIRRLAALPVPPRSVVIERLPPLPPRPRDIIIERWVPYGAQAKRRTIVQRAGAAAQYQQPRNVIIQYEPVQVRIVRQFQRLGVTQANPQAYLQQYGASLLDAATLVQQARAAGVVEDISPPAVAAAVGFGASTYGQESFGVAGGLDAGVGLVGGAAGLGGGYSSSSYESSSYSSGGVGGLEGGLVGGGLGVVGGATGLGVVGGAAGLGAGVGLVGGAAGLGGGYSSQSYESSSYSSTGGVGGGYGVAGGVNGAFNAADVNQDGRLDLGEFSSFVGQNVGGSVAY